MDARARVTGEFACFALPRFADGRLKPLVDKVFPLVEVADAHRYMAENRNQGKIVLSVG